MKHRLLYLLTYLWQRENRAEEWANNPENDAVTGTQFSSFHWSEKARRFAESISASVQPKGGFDASAGNFPPTPTDTNVADVYWITVRGTLPAPVGLVEIGNQIIWNPNNSNWFSLDTNVGVQSVNGRTGTVMLAAVDVGAVSTTIQNVETQVIQTDLTISKAGTPNMVLTSDNIGAGGVFLRNEGVTNNSMVRSLGVDTALGASVFSVDGGTQRLYSEQHKPTPAEIGAEPTVAADRKRKITVSTADPSGGADGDIWFKVS